MKTPNTIRLIRQICFSHFQKHFRGNSSTSLNPPSLSRRFFFVLLCFLSLGSAQSWGQTNNSLQFTQSNSDYISIPHNAALNLNGGDFTLEAWVYSIDGTAQTILSKGDAQANPNKDINIFAINGNKLALQLGNTTTTSETFQSTNNVPLNTWVHVAAVYNSGTKTVTFYVNGVPDGGGTFVNTLYNGDTNPMYIGRQGTACNCNFFDGQIDEVRLWNDQRTQKEISLNMNNAVVPASEANLVAYYQMNEGTANGNNTTLTQTFDLTANNHDGTLTNFAKTGAASNFVAGFTAINNALNFDGTDDYVDCGTSVDVTATGTFTMEGWVYLNSTATDQVFFGQDRAFVWMQAGGVLRCEFFDGSTYRGSPQDGGASPTLSTGQWYHIAASFGGTGTTVKVYINGVLSIETNVINANPENVTENFSIGRFGNNNSRYINGNIDEVRVWNVVRTCAEIKSTKDVELNGGETGLISYYNFNYGFAASANTNTTLYDLDATNSNNGTLTNFGALSGTTSNWVTSTNGVSGNTAVGQPEIDLKGNGTSIASANTAISTTDHTFFVSTALNSGNTRTYTIDNTAGTGTLTVSSITTSNSEFAISGAPTSIAGGGSATFTVTFTPTTDGTRTATITINNNDCNEGTYTFAVSGYGSGNANALDFDGTDDYVLTASSTGITDIADAGFTMEVWVYPTGISGTHSILRKTGDYNLFLNASRLDAEVWDNASSTYRQVQGPAFTTAYLNTWTHVAFTWDGSNGKFYINGIESSGTNQTPGTIGTSEDLVIGNSTIYPGNFFQGQMDEIRIWTDVRTQDELIANMNNELTGEEANLGAYYNFNQGTAGGDNTSQLTLYDVGVNGNNSSSLTSTGYTTGTGSTSLNSGATSNYLAGFTKKNNALDFNGTSDYVVTTLNRNAVTDFTMEAWIKYEGAAADGYQPIIASATQDFFIGKNTGNTDFGIQDNQYVGTISGTNAFDGNWHHIAVTRVNGTNTITLYIDGVQAYTSSGTFTGAAAGIIRIGNEPEGGGYFFNGKIDEVRIWSVARTCAEINSTKGVELTGTESNLVAYYNFNHGTAAGNNTGLTSLPDISTNSFAGTLTSFTGLDGSINSGQTSNWVDGSGNGVTGNTPANQPEANVQGNNVSIVDGDNTPIAGDNTSFGNIYLGDTKTVTYTIQNTGTAVLSITTIALSGAASGDYALGTLPTSVAAGGSETFTVTFTPTATGARAATVTITNGDCDEGTYNYDITGTGAQGAPGGVTTGLKLWLKADAGVTGTTSVTQWNDQSNSGVANATEATKGPQLVTGSLNFNPVLSFDAANSEYMTITGGIFGGSSYNDANAYVVSQTKSVSVSYPFHELLSDITGGIDRFSAHIPSNSSIFYWDAGEDTGDNRLSVAWGGSTSNYYLWSLNMSTTSTPDGNKQDISRDGLNIANDATANSFTGNNQDMTIGADNTPSNYWDANLGEVIIYTSTPSATEQQQIESYLAIKYGLTLDQTSATNYLDSDGATIWNATTGATYKFDIAGIGRDDASVLNQKQSKSSNSDAVLTIGLGTVATNNTSNSNTFTTDKKFMIWGNNDGSVDYTTNKVSDGPNSGVDGRLARVWQIQDGGVASTQVKIDISSLNMGAISSASELVLLIDDNGTDFSNSTLVFGNDLTGNVVTFNSVNFSGTQYISIGKWLASTQISVEKGNNLTCAGGTSQYVATTSLVTTASVNFTTEMWFQQDGGGAGDRYLFYNGNASTGYGLAFDGTYIVPVIDGTKVTNTTTAISANTWYHVALVGDGSKIILYVNGVEQVLGSTTLPTTASGSKTYIGADHAEANFFYGKIEELRFWGATRTLQQIQEQMHLVLDGSESGIVAYYQFNESSGNVLDAIGSNNGTLTNSPTRPASDCPVGKGRSETVGVTSLGEKIFSTPGMKITFVDGVFPEGNLVVTQIDGTSAPTNVPSDVTTYPSSYWIVHNYGFNSSFTEISKLEVTLPVGNTISVADEGAPSNIRLFKRASNSGSSDSWVDIGGASTATNSTRTLIFTVFTPDFTSFSQIIAGTTNSGTSPLPVTLGNFEATRQDETSVLIRWETLSEHDNAGFEIQRSENGTDYEILGFTDAIGNSHVKQSYQFTDAQNTRSAYYRLKQIDMNGEFKYSPVKFVQGNDLQKLSIYPNPFSTDLTISFGTKQVTKLPVYMEVFNTRGKLLLRSQGNISKVQQTLRQEAGKLNTGTYIMRIIVGNKVYIKRMVKQ